MPEERADVSPVACEAVAGIWVWERCGEGGVMDGREKRDAQFVARCEEDCVDMRKRSSVDEHRCVRSEVRDGANAFHSRDMREGDGWRGVTF